MIRSGEAPARATILSLLLLALILRLAWALTRPSDPAALAQLPDQVEYLAAARSLLQGEGLSFIDPRFGDRVFAYRTPGYPLLIAASGGNAQVVRVVQCLLDTSTVLAAYLLARRWLPGRPAVVAAAMVALNPFLIYFCGLLLTESLFTCMLGWGMFLLTSRRTVPWLVGGSTLALSVLVRPGAIALPVLLGVLAALLNPPPASPYHHRKWPLPVGTTMLLLTLAALLPWAWRNHRVLNAWVWTSTNAGITSYDGFNPDATGASDQTFVQRMPQLKGMTEVERNDYLAARAAAYARENPRRALELAAVKVARTWSPRPLSAEFSRPLYVLAAMAYAIPLFVLALLAVFGSRTLRPSAKLFLLAPAVYLTAAAATSVGSLRYRLPAEVPMAVLAAAGLAPALAGLARRPRPAAQPVQPADDPTVAEPHLQSKFG